MRSVEHSEELSVEGVVHAVNDARGGSASVLTDLMRRHNQRLYRIARGILRNDAEAEDIVQDTFVKAFTNLNEVRDATNIGAWLARVAVNLSISRLRQIRGRETTDAAGTFVEDRPSHESNGAMEINQISPEQLAAIRDVRKLLEQEIDKLTDGFREVFVLREVEQMTVAETADALGILPETVKTRLHRAKVQLRRGLEPHVTAVSLKAFPFGGERCSRTTQSVLRRLCQLPEILPDRKHNSHH